jgi:TBC1 domain family protein 5
LKKIINLDVNRTYQDKELFQTNIVKEILVNILFLWSKENIEVSYKQGMNEILGVILFGFYPFYFKGGKVTDVNLFKDPVSNYKELYYYFHDEDDLAADLYHVFNAIMNRGIKDLFEYAETMRDSVNYKKYELFQQQWTEEETQLAKDQLPLQRRCFLIIRQKLKTIDEDLYNHFTKIDLNCTIFLE